MNDVADDLAVAAVPVLGVEHGHLAEARRALLAQGRVVDDDDAIARLLWAARALPAAIDVLGDEQALGAPVVEIAAAPPERAALLAVARREPGRVVVEIVDARALFAAGDDDAAPCCIVTMPLVSMVAAAAGDDGISLRRFTIGPP